jgi:uncharacterized protein (TIGR03067 family)
MLRKLFSAFVMIMICSPAAQSADEPKETEGTWVPSAAELAGQKFPDEVCKSIKLVIKGDQYTVTVGRERDEGTCKRDTAAKPKTIDITSTFGPNKGRTLLAIYEREGDTMRVCYDLSGKERPKDFSTKKGTKLYLVTYQREKG